MCMCMVGISIRVEGEKQFTRMKENACDAIEQDIEGLRIDGTHIRCAHKRLSICEDFNVHEVMSQRAVGGVTVSFIPALSRFVCTGRRCVRPALFHVKHQRL